MPRLKLSPEDIVRGTDISGDELQKIFNGEIAIDRAVRDRLKPVLGDAAADMVFSHQEAFDYYEKHKKWQPPRV